MDESVNKIDYLFLPDILMIHEHVRSVCILRFKLKNSRYF